MVQICAHSSFLISVKCAEIHSGDLQLSVLRVTYVLFPARWTSWTIVDQRMVIPAHLESTGVEVWGRCRTSAGLGVRDVEPGHLPAVCHFPGLLPILGLTFLICRRYSNSLFSCQPSRVFI